MKIVYSSPKIIYYVIPKEKTKVLRGIFEPIAVANGQTIVVTNNKDKLEKLLDVTLKKEEK